MNFLFKISLTNVSKYANNCKFIQIQVKKSWEKVHYFNSHKRKEHLQIQINDIFVIMR